MSFVATQMDLEIVILSEVSNIEKDKYMILLICGIQKNSTNKTYLQNRIDSQMKKPNLWLPRGKRARGELGLTCTHCYV